MTLPRKLFAGLAAVLLTGCSTIAGGPGTGDVFVMRHLQAGTGDDPGLTEAGAADARRLAGWFKKAERPRAIYVSRFRRARETAASLSAELGVQPVVYDPSDSAALVEAVRAERGNVLVVGHSNTVPEIVERLGGTRPEPIQHHQHGDIWRVSRATGATERLKLGDR
jgi:phosphohistidine phosphatase SixA